VSGIGVIGRDYYGVFPLRGKLLNVREASGKSLTENAEIQALKQIMGLQHQKVYKDTLTLRYGHLMIMTDQVSTVLYSEDPLEHEDLNERITMVPISKA